MKQRVVSSKVKKVINMSYEVLRKYEYFTAITKRYEVVHGQNIYWIPYMEIKLIDKKERIMDLGFDIFFPPFIKNKFRIFALIRRLPKDRKELLVDEGYVVLKPNIKELSTVYNLWKKTYEESRNLYCAMLSKELERLRKPGFLEALGRLFMPMGFKKPISREDARISKELAMATAIAKSLLNKFRPTGEYTIVWYPFNIIHQNNKIQFYDLNKGCKDDVYTTLTKYDEGMKDIIVQITKL